MLRGTTRTRRDLRARRKRPDSRRRRRRHRLRRARERTSSTAASATTCSAAAPATTSWSAARQRPPRGWLRAPTASTEAPGSDALLGGTGPDTLLARDGRRDLVDGGRGTDLAIADRALDRLVSVERRRFPSCDVAGGAPVRQRAPEPRRVRRRRSRPDTGAPAVSIAAMALAETILRPASGGRPRRDRSRHRRAARGGARAAAQPDRADRVGELHLAVDPRGRRLGADEQVRRGVPREALLRRLRDRRPDRAARDRPGQGAVRRRARERPAARRRPGEHGRLPRR